MKKNYASFTLTDSDTDADSMNQRFRTDSAEIREFQHLRSEYYNTSPWRVDFTSDNLISASLTQMDKLKYYIKTFIFIQAR